MTPIDYATPPPRRNWLRRHARRLVAVALLVAVGFTSYAFRRPAEHYVRWHYWHWQLSRYAMSPRDAVAPPTTVPTSPTAGTRCLAPPLVALGAVDPMVAAMTRSFGGFGPGPTRGVDYVGQRRRPDGASRTVVITLVPELYQPFNGAAIAVIERPGLLSMPPTTLFVGGGMARSGPAWPALVECVDDPADASAILVTLHPVKTAYGGMVRHASIVPSHFRATLSDADEIQWVRQLDGGLGQLYFQPRTLNRATMQSSRY